MRSLFFQDKETKKIQKLKKQLGKALEISIEISNKEVRIKSRKEDSFSEYISSKIIEAIALGFDLDAALQLKDQNFILRKINIKDHVKESRVKVVTARIIGTKGKTKELIEKLSDCDIIIHDHTIAVIGTINNIEVASRAILSLMRGSPQSKVYSFLERSRAKLKELNEENIEEIIKQEITEKERNGNKNKNKKK